jgi:hypothetical protein
MDATEQFRQIGFDVEVEQAALDLYWCDLIKTDGGSRVPHYGSGSTEQEAIESAWQRHQAEQ